MPQSILVDGYLLVNVPPVDWFFERAYLNELITKMVEDGNMAVHRLEGVDEPYIAVNQWYHSVLEESAENEEVLNPQVVAQRRRRNQQGSIVLQSAVYQVIVYRGPRSFKCSECGAYMWYNEGQKVYGKTLRDYAAVNVPNFHMCCANGDVKLPPIRTHPEILGVLDAADAINTHFCTYIRSYNNAFAFTSSSAKFDRDLVSSTNGVSTFRVQGKNLDLHKSIFMIVT